MGLEVCLDINTPVVFSIALEWHSGQSYFRNGIIVSMEISYY